MRFVAEMYEPLYEFNDRRYIRIVVPDTIVSRIVSMQKKKVRDNPLDGNILRVKVPYRYRRCMCKVEGITPVEAMVRGDSVEVDVSFAGAWQVGDDYTGYTWKLDWIKM